MKGDNKSSNTLTLEDIENLTGYSKISKFTLGESVEKYLGFKGATKTIIRNLRPTFIIPDRFERELEVLSFLQDHKEDFGRSRFTIPVIKDVWKDEKLVALSFIEGSSGYLMKPKEIENYVKLMQSFHLPRRFNLRDTLVTSLMDLNKIRKEYRNEFQACRDIILSNFEWTQDKESFIHGDLHKSNLIQTKSGKIGLIDWEYATNGSIIFDLASYEVMSKHRISAFETQIALWKPLIQLMLTHWHMSWYPENEEAYPGWLNDLKDVAKV